MSFHELTRPQTLTERIVIIDGFSCAGKSLVAPLLSSFKDGELWQINYLYEYFCSLYALGQVRKDAAMTMLKLTADIDLYNLMIGRSVNLRKEDVSSAYRNHLAHRYLERMEGTDGASVVDHIRKTRPILFLMVHYIFDKSKIMFEAFGRRLRLYIVILSLALFKFLSISKSFDSQRCS